MFTTDPATTNGEQQSAPAEGSLQRNLSMLAASSVRRRKYSLHKESLDKVIEELERWQQIFDPSWYLIIRSAVERVDTELARSLGESSRSTASSTTLYSAQTIRFVVKNSGKADNAVFIQEAGLKNAEKTIIRFSNMQVTVKSGSRRSKSYILDTAFCPPYANPEVLTRDVQDLARRLSQSDPMTFSLLTCKGVLKPSSGPEPPSSFTFVFHVPSRFSSPESLRGKLTTADKSHSFSERFRLANQLATSVSYVHDLDSCTRTFAQRQL
jgi:hypothetical protein